MDDLDKLGYYLGLSSERDKHVLLLSQAFYCKRVPRLFGMISAKPASAPLIDSLNNLFLEASAEKSGDNPY